MTIRSIISTLSIIAGVILLSWFLWTRIEGLIHGAYIEIATPQHGQTIENGTTLITGTTKRTTKLCVNTSPISTKPDGSFEATLLVPYGNSILVIDAYDRYNNHTQVTRTVYRPKE